MDGELRCVSCTPEQVASYLGVSVRTVRNWVDRKKLDGGRIDRTIRVNGDDVRRAFPTGGRGTKQGFGTSNGLDT